LSLGVFITKFGKMIISVKNLTKKFGNFTAVDNISFEIEQWEIFAFLWPNGSGKSTTIKMLTTILHPTEWEIVIDGANSKEDKNTIRKSFGIVFQDPSLDDELTAYENLELHGMLYKVPKDIRRKRIEEMLKFVELRSRKDDFVKNFSGGMKRRLEIARGLIHHPKIFFLDEPTIGLDPQTRNHIWDYIKKLNKEEWITIFLTTHYMDEAEKMANKIAIMDHWKIITQWTLEELKKETNTETLEEAFLSLTGKDIREEQADPFAAIKMHMKR